MEVYFNLFGVYGSNYNGVCKIGYQEKEHIFDKQICKDILPDYLTNHNLNKILVPKFFNTAKKNTSQRKKLNNDNNAIRDKMITIYYLDRVSSNVSSFLQLLNIQQVTALKEKFCQVYPFVSFDESNNMTFSFSTVLERQYLATISCLCWVSTPFNSRIPRSEYIISTGSRTDITNQQLYDRFCLVKSPWYYGVHSTLESTVDDVFYVHHIDSLCSGNVSQFLVEFYDGFKTASTDFEKLKQNRVGMGEVKFCCYKEIV